MLYVLPRNMRAKITLLITVAFTMAGCATSRIESATVGKFDQLDRSSLSLPQQELLASAKLDFNLVKARRAPVNAQLKYRLRDGGTRVYGGDGYTLIANGRMETRRGVFGQLVGPTITLERKITGGRPIRIEDTQFVPSSRKNRAEQGGAPDA